MDEKLKEIFYNINDWLKYAEAKSATLIAVNGALIFGISDVISSFNTTGFLTSYLVFCLVLCSISLAICLLSVIPSLKMPWDAKPKGVLPTDNIFYFADIAKYTPQTFLKKLAKRINEEHHTFSGYQQDLTQQIIVNSVLHIESIIISLLQSGLR
ncbi:MAG: DUF5706 domain-containing protein [Ghiorsea sp.]|nr:DUF5706 domain-containing protein [Ghiorsea sp.]